MSKETAIVFDIARCSIHDGPGIRTTVFLKGCSMDCEWCHNPESKSGEPQISINPNTGVKRLIGEEMTVEQIIAVVKKDMDYYRDSDGGLTISGGECLLHPDFTAALAKSAQALGIHVVIETAGMVQWSAFEKVLPYVDLFLFDYKDSNPDRLLKYTGGSYQLIESNFSKLYDRGVAISRRCLLIPGINDTETHFKAICEQSIIRARHNFTMELLFYHNLGISKAENIGEIYKLSTTRNLDNPDDIQCIKGSFSSIPHENIHLKNKRLE